MYEDYLYIFDEYLSVCPVREYAQYLEQIRTYLIKSIENENFMGIYFAIHLLFMCFIYQKIWQLHKLHTEKIDFVLDFISKKKRSGSHFDYAKIGETNISNFLSLFDCEKEEIAKYESLIRDRNQFAHASGKILDEQTIEITVKRYIDLMEKIQDKSKKVVEDWFISEFMEYDDYLKEGNEVDQEFNLKFLEPFLCSKFDILLILKYLELQQYEKTDVIKSYLQAQELIEEQVENL